MNRREQELDAAEYVIGTLSGVERRAFEDLMMTDRQTQEDVWYWERAFGALNASISPDAPPAAMWERISGSLPSENAPKRRPNVLKAKLLKNKKKAKADQPDVPPVENETPASVVPISSEVGETLKKQESAVSRIWTKNIPKPVAPEPVAEVEDTTVDEENADIEDSNDADENTDVEEDVLPSPVPAKSAVEEVVTPSSVDTSGKLRRWRFIALAALVGIVGLIGWIFSQGNSVGGAKDEVSAGAQKDRQFLAVVNANGTQPSLVVRLNQASGTLQVDPIGILIPQKKSLQLWYRPKEGNRVAIGLLGGDMTEFNIADAEEGGVLEVTVEPEGGAPDDGPSGPVVYSGALGEVGVK